MSTHAKEDLGSGQSKAFVFLIDMNALFEACVALSRCRSLTGLSPERPPYPWDVILDLEVLYFHEWGPAGEFMEEVPA